MNYKRKGRVFVMAETKRRMSYFMLCVVFFAWGSLYVVSKYAFAAIPPVTVLCFRNVLGVIPLGYLAWKKGLKKIECKDIPFFLAAGFFGYTMAVGLQLMASSLMDASISSLINSVNPLFTTFFAVFLLREKITLNKIAGIVISVTGVAVILGVGNSHVSLAGVLCSAGSVMLWSLTSVGIRGMSGRYSSQQITFTGILIAVPFSILGAVWEVQRKPISFTPGAVMAVLYMAFVCTALANYLWAKCLQQIDASICTMFYPLQPLFATTLGILFLHEKLTRNILIGGVLISAGVICGVYQKHKS